MDESFKLIFVQKSTRPHAIDQYSFIDASDCAQEFKPWMQGLCREGRSVGGSLKGKVLTKNTCSCSTQVGELRNSLFFPGFSFSSVKKVGLNEAISQTLGFSHFI